MPRGSSLDSKNSNFYINIINSLKDDKSKPIKILDFGCNNGSLVMELKSKGFDTFGCDIDSDALNSKFSKEFNQDRILRKIDLENYKIPFESNQFDFVISCSVLEHVHNKEIAFNEIKRVLKSKGYTINVFPSKWYLPKEPHMQVPLVNFFLPNCPKWWLSFFALVGIRKKYKNVEWQSKKTKWNLIVDENLHYANNYLSYITNKNYEEISLRVFNNFSWGDIFYIKYTKSSMIAKVARYLPFKKISGYLIRNFRMSVLISQKI